MFDDTTLAPTMLANPAMMQSMVLTEFQNRLNGVYSVADPNNTFNILLEAASSINSQSVRFMQTSFNAQYAVRAITSTDLYNNMSDFDYLSLVAGPSQTSLYLTFDADYLKTHAQSYDSTYNRVVIPVGTQFSVGPLTFGIYYPINININVVTGNINVLWDTTTPNPLYTLATNMVPFVQYTSGGLNLIALTIPVFQFAVSTTTYAVVQQQGFIRSISYADQFYSARVFTNLPTGSWTELAYTLSETVYDPTTPTAKLKIQSDINTLGISVPQIYFTNGQIGNQIMVMVYTTKGTITLDLTSVEISNCNCNFGLNTPGIVVSPNSTILANLATIILQPAAKVITGGSDALSFSQLRNLVINGGLYNEIPITPAQLTAFAAKKGFVLSKYLDNVTDRIYYASNTIVGGQNGYIMVTTATLAVLPLSTTLPSSIINFPTENAVTILPTTIYKYNTTNDVCNPLSDTEVVVLKNMTSQGFADEVNTNTYVQSPFHIVTYTGAQYPITKSFNLMNPVVTDINFVGDNVYLTPQMSAVSSIVIHNNGGTGGFTLRLGVTKTPAMTTIAESDITVYVSAKDINGDTFYGIATATGTAGSLTIYDLSIPTTYYLSQQSTFRSSMNIVGQTTVGTVDIPLSCTFTVTFLITPSLYPTVAQDIALVNVLATPYNTLLGVCQQQLAIVFGTDLSSQVFNNTNALWSSIEYAKYPQTVYLTYPNDVYETNAEGGLVYTTTGSTPPISFTKLHSKGDRILDGSGNPIVQFAEGSTQLDANDSPIVMSARQLQYFVTSMVFDIRLFYSANQADITFVQSLTGTLSAYFSTIASIQSNLLEQTNLYYKPNSTMGQATFSSGNNTPLTLNLGFSFSYVVYVSQATLDNPTLQATISADIITLTQNEMTNSVISLTDIATNIKSQLSDTIISIDVDGIDTQQTLQTVIVPPGTTTPIIAQKLVYNVDSGSLSLQPNVTITFELAA